MRLKEHDDAASRRTYLRSRERRLNLRRVMTVIVNDEHARLFAFELKAAVCVRKVAQGFADSFERHFQLEADGNRRERVIDVVKAGCAQTHFAH